MLEKALSTKKILFIPVSMSQNKELLIFVDILGLMF